MPSDGDDEVFSATDDPDAPPVVDVPASANAETAAKELAADAEARRTLWPWVARRTRPQIISLVLISLLALGPAFALGSILRSDPTPVNTLLEAPAPEPKVTRITVTATRMSPTAGEMQARILIEPSGDLLDGAGKLTHPLSVAVNGSQGASTRTFLTGESPSSFDVSLPMSEGNTSRYPFDSYKGRAGIVVTTETGDGRKANLSVAEAKSIISDFDLSGAPDSDVGPAGQAISVVNLTATRPATTTVYAVWLMILMWGLAVTGLLLVWAVVIWMVDLPFWAVGYLVGVLFALPQLRDSLPGRPPPGTIFDYGSFYWSVTVVGVSLILVLVVWLRRVRDESRLRSLDATKDT